jgi:predicted metal-dependent phosphoesterase TrpH
VIDLHLHTTASDGRSEPEDLARRAAAAGLRTIAVTDHDTTAGVARARAAAAPLGVDVVMGIEITAVHAGRDVHLLGYFFDDGDPELTTFLERQRADRRRRIGLMLDRLRALGIALDEESVRSQAAAAGKAIGRPAIAGALVTAGHADNIADAFDRFIAEGRPGFIARQGAPPADVVALIARAGGVSSFAHPGKLGLDDLLPDLAQAGLTAVEVFHPDHGRADSDRYMALAQALGLLVSGGSDYHGPASGRVDAMGVVHLPDVHFQALKAQAEIARHARGPGLGGPGL